MTLEAIKEAIEKLQAIDRNPRPYGRGYNPWRKARGFFAVVASCQDVTRSPPLQSGLGAGTEGAIGLRAEPRP